MNDYTKILGENTGEIVLRPVLTPFAEAGNIRETRNLEARGSFGCLQLREIEGNDYLIRHYNFLLNQDDTLTFVEEKPALRLSLALKYSFHYKIEGLEEGVLHERGFNISYTPSLHQSLHLRANRHYSCVEFRLSISYLQQLASYFPDVELFLQTAGQQRPVFLNGINQVASMEMLTIIDEILYCTYPALIRKKYLGYKVKEILILALQKIVHPPAQKAVYLSERIASRIYEAREILSKDLSSNHTPAELSARVGLSIYNLKKGFRAIYGLTVTDFLHEARMQKARLLLSETDLPVSRIAAATGYSHPFAFSSAFKKYFGYTPSLVQKSRKQRFVYS